MSPSDSLQDQLRSTLVGPCLSLSAWLCSIHHHIESSCRKHLITSVMTGRVFDRIGPDGAALSNPSRTIAASCIFTNSLHLADNDVAEIVQYYLRDGRIVLLVYL